MKHSDLPSKQDKDVKPTITNERPTKLTVLGKKRRSSLKEEKEERSTVEPEEENRTQKLPKVNRSSDDLSTEEEAFQTEFGDELSFLVENSCAMDPKPPQFMPYIT
ncbi:hypothetical protein PROFUN_15003 [Planoprotostelium fungivorum]|uniref:Uncharacterized protein n=1 Tax=Planoprotostelium fungivorum TaxID=1890364 RepID=A0A2P6MY06_9EUKA|nr:hypothetical protein PROFUN_15003 [Planoprotostelium fungivorum]